MRSVFLAFCALLWLADAATLQAQLEGFYPKIGGLPTESGFALGVGYQRNRLASNLLDLRLELIGSFKKYEHAELRLDMPRLWNERLFAGFALRYRNYPEENFWGLGGKTEKGRETSFRLEDVDYQGRFGYRPLPWLRLGALAGYRQTNTGPGQDSCCLSTELAFPADDVPGLDRQPHHAYGGVFVEMDARDSSTDPRSGTFAEIRWTYYDDRDLRRFSFRQYEAQIQHYVAVSENRGTIALRARTVLTDAASGQQVPFFLQPAVGGSRDLRGFRQSRFRDRNALAANLEFRWRLQSFLDGIAFGDAGTVSRNSGDFRLHRMEGSVGLGSRLKFRERVFLGFDLGWSREGLRFWVQGAHTF